MLKIGLTGGIASGKTTVCNLFADSGIHIIDADVIARQLVEPNQPCLTEIEQQFGSQYLSANGELDRAQLRKIIFNDPEAKSKLENILHPNIRKQMLIQANAVESPYVIFCVPLLIESNMHTLVDRVLVIHASEQTQLERLCKRDQIELELAQNMLRAQLTNEQRLSHADDIIENETDAKQLAEKVKQLHNQYLNTVISSK